jgi:tripartite-type tricarboxylate transporter receptor subunit TctC
MRRRDFLGVLSGAAAWPLGGNAQPVRAAADPVADFYAGKQIQMVIGYGAGGGYDLYARFTAEFLRKHIPGNPNIVPQNMPGAGSLKAMHYLYSVAPKDGTVLGAVDQSLVLNTVASTERIDVSAFSYLGRLNRNIDVGAGLPGRGFRDFADARRTEIKVGVSLEASTAVLLPSALKEYGGAQFKLIRGYSGSAEIMLALQRGEVDLVGGIGLPLLLVRNPDWIAEGKAVILYQNALERHPLLPNVPTLPELGLTPDGITFLRVVASTAEIGRSILTTPGVPPARLAALRKAFQDMVADPEYLAAAKQRNIEVSPASGARIDEIVRETSRLPQAIIDKVNALAKAGR